MYALLAPFSYYTSIIAKWELWVNWFITKIVDKLINGQFALYFLGKKYSYKPRTVVSHLTVGVIVFVAVLVVVAVQECWR